MKKREEVSKFIAIQMNDQNYEPDGNKNGCHHYGWQELKDLMDFIYCRKPKNEKEKLNR